MEQPKNKQDICFPPFQSPETQLQFGKLGNTQKLAARTDLNNGSKTNT